MQYSYLYNLVKMSTHSGDILPDLEIYGTVSCLAHDPETALAEALRICPFLDWDKYVDRNHHIRKIGIDPVSDFLNNGVFEGKKIFLKKSTAQQLNRPKVSIIVPNYNNAQYLMQSINSLIYQTLEDIEIIIIDDASTDDSITILRDFAKQDSRIKLVEFENNQSQHMAKKAGVAISTGAYVMFLDPDDHYNPDACSVAYAKASQGFDIVIFNADIVSPEWANPVDERHMANYLKSGAEGEIIGDNIVEALYVKREYCRSLWNKIYDGDMCRRVFHQLQDGYFRYGEDLYEALALAIEAKSAAKINNILYIYRTRVGISTPTESRYATESSLSLLKIIEPVKKLLVESGNMHLYDLFLDKYFINQAIDNWLKFVPNTMCAEVFIALANVIGIVDLLCRLKQYGSNHYVKIAEKYAYFAETTKAPASIRAIGILYTFLGDGGAERVIKTLIEYLVVCGYEVILFLYESSPSDINLPEQVKIHYLNNFSGDSASNREHLQALDNALRRNPVDVLFHHALFSFEVFWQLALIKYRGIPIIFFAHSSFCSKLIDPKFAYVHHHIVAALKCADKVCVLSRLDELYYRIRNIDAKYIANPVRLVPELQDAGLSFKERSQYIIVVGRLSANLKNVHDCLLVLRELITVRPWIKMLFIGSFTDDKSRRDFTSLVHDYKLVNNVEVTGWLLNSTDVINKAAVMLSCSYIDAFSLAIAEALGRGIPCVIYDLNIAPAENNPAVIKVPQGAFAQAAFEILKLLSNESRWSELSNIARSKSIEFSEQIYFENIDSLLDSFASYSVYEPYCGEQYTDIMKLLSFYGGNIPPWLLKKRDNLIYDYDRLTNNNNDLANLVKNSLPDNLDPDRLFNFINSESYYRNPESALYIALHKYTELDWQAYEENNPDVKQSGIDPVRHYLTDGIYEGRKLYARFHCQSKQIKTNPLISIIIPNFNNSLYLKTSIESVTKQSLKNIEIIIIDDDSSDNSLAVIENLANQDSRIRTISLKTNQSQHMARKIGVEASLGKYIMFLDSDDLFTTNACEKAYDAASKGFDMVVFNAKLLSPIYADRQQETVMRAYLNRGDPAIYEGFAIVYAAYFEGKLSDILWNRIYDGDMCRLAFAEMKNEYMPRGQDNYEAFVLTTKARRCLKIGDELYIYRTGIGISTPDISPYKIKSFSLTGKSLIAVREYMQQHSCALLEQRFTYAYMHKPRRMLLENLPPQYVTDFFNAMASQVGIVDLICGLKTYLSAEIIKIARQFRHYEVKCSFDQSVKRIGILYSRINPGGAEKVIVQQAKALVQDGYEVTMFLEAPGQYEHILPATVNVVYIGVYSDSADVFNKHITSLYVMLRQHPVDVMLCHFCYSAKLLWQLLLIKYMGVLTILFPHGAYFSRLLHPGDVFDLGSHGAMLQCGDKVCALSTYAELYWRMLGIDAWRIHNPIELRPEMEKASLPFSQRNDEILVIGRLDDQVKNINDCLKILANVIKDLSSVRMTFVGTMPQGQELARFKQLVTKYGVKHNVAFTSWVDDPAELIMRAKVILSCSYTENFPLAIAESQALGLPCVMYHIPISLAEDNPAIMSVPQGDDCGASQAIKTLMVDGELWTALSNLAKEKIKRFSAQSYIAKLSFILQNFMRISPIRHYSAIQYKEVLKSLAFYGGNRTPWEK